MTNFIVILSGSEGSIRVPSYALGTPSAYITDASLHSASIRILHHGLSIPAAFKIDGSFVSLVKVR